MIALLLVLCYHESDSRGGTDFSGKAMLLEPVRISFIGYRVSMTYF